MEIYKTHTHTHTRAKSLQSYPTLCNSMDYSLPSPSVHGVLQARIVEWIATPSSRDLPDPENEPASPTFQGESLPLS